MSTVGAHDVPPSRERATPPTWTLPWMAPSSATAIDRTSAGSPQGVYQASRPSTVSNDGMGASPAPVSRKRRACSVPTRTPSRVGATHVAGGPSIDARVVQAPSRSSSSAEPSTTAQTDRSEEHTSELQSHSDLVCRLLLEKKKKQINITHNETYKR